MYIEDLGLQEQPSNGGNIDVISTKILKFADDSKLLKEVSSNDDVEKLQDNLDVIYRWADVNHMRWNSLKFQILRFDSKEIRYESNIFAPNMEEVIKIKEVVHHLSFLINDSMCYVNHIKKVISKVNNMTAWALRMFCSREKFIMRKIWRSLIQCYIDYGCIMWYSVGRKGDMRALEDQLRTFTKKYQDYGKNLIMRGWVI